jgi:disulfide bond formation protein DsbB
MNFLYKNVYYIALIQAIAATVFSLYASEVLHLVPCILCWYQRILMYPLIPLLIVGILRKDKGLPLYVLPLSLLGIGIAFYHYLLQQGIVGSSLVPCQTGVSCATKYIVWFGFITIPVLSLAAFSVITLCMLIAKKHTKV